jgi:hypothetical protein
LEKIREIALVLMNPAVEKASAVNALLIIGIWGSFRDVYFLPRWRGLMTVRSKNLLKPIRKVMSNG